MDEIRCTIGDIKKTKEGILILTVTCVGEEITEEQMVEAVSMIDLISETTLPLLVDISARHSASYGALTEMSKAKKVSSVAIYAPRSSSYHSASFIEKFQTQVGHSIYPFKSFADFDNAQRWLRSFL